MQLESPGEKVSKGKQTHCFKLWRSLVPTPRGDKGHTRISHRRLLWASGSKLILGFQVHNGSHSGWADQRQLACHWMWPLQRDSGTGRWHLNGECGHPNWSHCHHPYSSAHTCKHMHTDVHICTCSPLPLASQWVMFNMNHHSHPPVINKTQGPQSTLGWHLS